MTKNQTAYIYCTIFAPGLDNCEKMDLIEGSNFLCRHVWFYHSTTIHLVKTTLGYCRCSCALLWRRFRPRLPPLQTPLFLNLSGTCLTAKASVLVKLGKEHEAPALFSGQARDWGWFSDRRLFKTARKGANASHWIRPWPQLREAP